MSDTYPQKSKTNLKLVKKNLFLSTSQAVTSKTAQQLRWELAGRSY